MPDFQNSDDPYLPAAKSHYALAVDRQAANPASFLNYTRQLFRWRKEQPALIRGQARVIKKDGDVFAILRQSENQTLLFLMNASGQKQSFKPSDYLDDGILAKLRIKKDQVIQLGPYSNDRYGANPMPLIAPRAAVTAPSKPCCSTGKKAKRCCTPA